MSRFLLRSVQVTALAALLASAPSFARERVDVNVIDRDTARPLAEYSRHGDTWVEGRPGRTYTLQLTNHSDRRVLVVLSVDGINVITGQQAGFNQAGYVLEPYETAEIDGWRKSLQHSAQFYFTRVPDSYAARTGRPDDVGVIGAAVFAEKREVPVFAGRPAMAESRAAPPPAAAMSKSNADASAQRVGTGHGALQYSEVSRTQFKRASSRPESVVVIRYDDRARLEALGILPRKPLVGTRPAPRPFPGFVPDPPY